MPLDGWISPTRHPLIMMEYETDRTQPIINCIHLSANTSLRITSSKKANSTRSYALLISSLKPINLVLLHIRVCIECKVSNATRILSVINLPEIKALCVQEIIFGNTIFSLLASTLEINFYKTLQRLIGLKSETNSGCNFFGIRTT
jgi:hypothetical protein